MIETGLDDLRHGQHWEGSVQHFKWKFIIVYDPKTQNLMFLTIFFFYPQRLSFISFEFFGHSVQADQKGGRKRRFTFEKYVKF
jgi:hypothetical protein